MENILNSKLSVGCCALTTPILCTQIKGVVMGQHPTKNNMRVV